MSSGAGAATDSQYTGRFVRASKLQDGVRYCPGCDGLEATIRYDKIVPDEGCQGKDMVQYRRTECGFPYLLGLIEDDDEPHPDAGGGSQ